ncbi:WecB/TagA/CpsF family glycosyltransferase [Heliobacillus mobilis]|uniref:N-acetylglucosaminyldiphosphoundecaprenol N-acetyl-beta-D-mannosaminyltransferase n=1 Tax=Heliobacterium mobile TaxID=28064 RepID=A0A6I3SKY8_HELMO|nr:WecB/TagA/CpsF family glycosyltransferase [Heliobacterium mobile]MTV49601.1 WecB/TagA/CpsF family glycosyltransferase [Heliobacterium mobile]
MHKEPFKEHPRVTVLGSPVDKLTMDDAVSWVEKKLDEGGARQVITANPEILYEAASDGHLRQLIEEADLVTADGIGVLWAAAQGGDPLPERITGIDLMAALLNRAAQLGWPVCLLGGKPGVADEAAKRLCRQYPNLQVAFTGHGYFNDLEEQEIIRKIGERKPYLLFVGLGAPRQEYWIANLIRNHLPPKAHLVAIGIGGSLDVFAGQVQRAPKWAQRFHIEWLYRLITQPSRLKRQLKLPLFVLTVLRQKGK